MIVVPELCDAIYRSPPPEWPSLIRYTAAGMIRRMRLPQNSRSLRQSTALENAHG
jgi:hypothetical protein